MEKPKPTLPEQYFNDVYRASDDPWQFKSSPYERAKYEATLAALPTARYQSAYEIGCSIGILSALLAERCDKLLSVDASTLPLTAARERLARYPHVTVAQQYVPAQFSDDSFDLILLSEVGYYLSLPDLHQLQQRILDQLRPMGQLLLVHWTPFVPDYPLTGDQVHDEFMALAADGQLLHAVNQRTDTYRLDLFQKP
jgi:trans-aconitate methyltransferase